MTLGTQATGHPLLDLLTAMPLVLGTFWSVFTNLIPALLGLGSGLIGGGDEEMPRTLPTQFPSLTSSFTDWMSSQLFQKPGGGWDMYGYEAFPGLGGGGSAQGPGTDMINGLSPDIADTILPRVYDAWQPMDTGTMHLANFLVNGPIGQEDPRAKHVMEWGGFGGPGHNAMVTASQYGVPSEAGKGLANMAQWGVTGPEIGQYMANLAQYGVASQPMADFMRAATSGGLNPHRKVEVPTRG